MATDSGAPPAPPAGRGPEPGDRGEARQVVEAAMTAAALGSGDVQVLATPMVAALAERAAVAALAGRLPPGWTSVGIELDLRHTAPTPPGAEVVAVAVVESVEGRRVAFSFEVSDPAGGVASGSHLRVVLDRDGFLTGARDRLAGGPPR